MTGIIRKTFPVIVLLIISAVLLLPLFHHGFIVTDDGTWMIIRLSAFYQSLREGQFPVRFLGRLNYNYGYPVANFLYPGFLYIGTFIHATGFSFVTTIKLLMGASLISGGIWMFLWLRKFFRVLPSLLGAISWISGPYILFDLYTRGSVGELLAFSMVAMGLYSIEARLPWLLSLSVSLLILSHNSIAFIFIILFAGYLLLRKVPYNYFVWLIGGLAVSSFFWMPAIYEQKYIIFDRAVVSNPMEYFVQYKSIWLIGAAGTFAWLLMLFRKVKFPMLNSVLWIFVISTIMAIPISAPLWNIRIFNSLFQFPFRFLSIGLFASAWLIAGCMETFRKYQIFIGCALIVMIAIHLRLIYSGIRYEYQPEGFYTTNEATTTVKNEYMPKWVTTMPSQRADEKIELIKGAGSIEKTVVTSQNINVLVEAKQNSIIQINTMYYPGWGVTIDNVPVLIDYHNEMGVMRISVPDGEHRVIASFRETISRFIADIISFVSVIIYLIVTTLWCLKRRRMIYTSKRKV